MSTQLHLVEGPAVEGPAVGPTRPGRPETGATASRRRHDQWRIDARTRRIGRAGVAAAREALERARGHVTPPEVEEQTELPRAS
jgi:hypothetical protein